MYVFDTKYTLFTKKTSVLESLGNQKACNFIKKRLQHTCFPVNIAKFLKVQSFILCNNKYMIASTQITTTEIFAFGP